MVALQEKYHAIAAGVSNELDKINCSFVTTDLDAFAQAAKDTLLSLSSSGQMPVASTTSQKILQKALDQLPARAQEVKDLEKTLRKSDKAIAKLLDEARRIDHQRRDASRGLSIAIGAGEKLRDKFDGNLLKNAIKRANKDFTEKNKQRLKDVVKHGQQFSERLARLEESRSTSDLARQQISHMTDTIKQHRVKIVEITDTSANEWRAMLHVAGVAIDSKARKPKNRKAPQP